MCSGFDLIWRMCSEGRGEEGSRLRDVMGSRGHIRRESMGDRGGVGRGQTV